MQEYTKKLQTHKSYVNHMSAICFLIDRCNACLRTGDNYFEENI